MKPDYITPEMFEKMVNLAALELDPSQSEYLRRELNHQLAAVKELSEIELDENITASLHGLECQGNPPRQDRWFPFPDPRSIVALAPENAEGMISVPDVAESQGEVK